MAEILACKRACATVIEVVSTALAASGLISLNFFDDTVIKVSAAALAFLSLGLTLYKAFANLDSRISAHQKVACKLWLLRERYINLISDLSESRLSEADALLSRNELQIDTHKTYEEAPQTSAFAYRRAQKALKRDEDFTFSASEIDRFLPASLKMQQP
jgi:hypothetical protein